MMASRIRWPFFILLAVALAIGPLAPALVASTLLMTLLAQGVISAIFATSIGLLIRQSGLISFGHAAFYGLSAYCLGLFIKHGVLAAHWAILAAVLVPTLIALALGLVIVRIPGVAFSMITLGIVELVFACSLMFPGFFGGEGGVSGNRVFGQPLLGISFGPQIQVYYLIAFWLFISTAAMFALAHTPLGRIANAVRDNPERAEFVGYDPQRVRFLMLMLSAFFAGISGGLTAINFEIVSAENVSAARSGEIGRAHV